MSQSVEESVFNVYRNLAYCLLEGTWNTRHLSPADRTARAEADYEKGTPYVKKLKERDPKTGRKIIPLDPAHVKRREKRLALRRKLARKAEDEAEARANAENKAYDDESDGRDYMKDQARKK